MSVVSSSIQPTLRPMREDDLHDVLEVEQRAYQYPWSAGILRDCVRVGYICRVCELQSSIVGHSILSVAANESHLLNLCVDPIYQHRGIGRYLLREMICIAQQAKAETLFLEVRASNIAATSLYLDEGFNEIGVRSNYYPAKAGREDAIIYAMHL